MNFQFIEMLTHLKIFQGESSPPPKPVGSLSPIGSPLQGPKQLPPNIGKLLNFMRNQPKVTRTVGGVKIGKLVDFPLRKKKKKKTHGHKTLD